MMAPSVTGEKLSLTMMHLAQAVGLLADGEGAML